MAQYNPPSQNLPIFDSGLFGGTNSNPGSVPSGDFLNFPNAQGDENLLGITVADSATFNADSTFNDVVEINDDTTFSTNIIMSGTYLTNYLEFPDGSQQFNASAGGTGDALLAGGTSSTPQVFTGYNKFSNTAGQIILTNTTQSTPTNVNISADSTLQRLNINSIIKVDGDVFVGNTANSNLVGLSSAANYTKQLDIAGYLNIQNASNASSVIIASDATNTTQLNIQGALSVGNSTNSNSVILTSASGSSTALEIGGGLTISNGYQVEMTSNSTTDNQLDINAQITISNTTNGNIVLLASDTANNNQLDITGALSTTTTINAGTTLTAGSDIYLNGLQLSKDGNTDGLNIINAGITIGNSTNSNYCILASDTTTNQVLNVTSDVAISTVQTYGTTYPDQNLATIKYVNGSIPTSLLGTNNTWTGTNAFSTTIPTTLTADTGDNTTKLATTAFVQTAVTGGVGGYAELAASNNFTGPTNVFNAISGTTITANSTSSTSLVCKGGFTSKTVTINPGTIGANGLDVRGNSTFTCSTNYTGGTTTTNDWTQYVGYNVAPLTYLFLGPSQNTGTTHSPQWSFCLPGYGTTVYGENNVVFGINAGGGSHPTSPTSAGIIVGSVEFADVNGDLYIDTTQSNKDVVINNTSWNQVISNISAILDDSTSTNLRINQQLQLTDGSITATFGPSGLSTDNPLGLTVDSLVNLNGNDITNVVNISGNQNLTISSGSINTLILTGGDGTTINANNGPVNIIADTEINLTSTAEINIINPTDTWFNLTAPNSGDGVVYANFYGNLNGNATTATSSTNTTNVAITDNNTSATYYPTFVSNNTGNLQLQVDKTTNPLSYIPSTGNLTSTLFTGLLSTGGLVYLSTGSASITGSASATNFSLSSIFNSTYKNYRIVLAPTTQITFTAYPSYSLQAFLGTGTMPTIASLYGFEMTSSASTIVSPVYTAGATISSAPLILAVSQITNHQTIIEVENVGFTTTAGQQVGLKCKSFYGNPGISGSSDRSISASVLSGATITGLTLQQSPISVSNNMSIGYTIYGYK